MSDALWWLALAGLACVGATCGSFLNVVIYRVPRSMSIAYPHSRCPQCAHVIYPSDNIPIVSWFWLRGRCRHCRRDISLRYPAMEALAMLMFLVVGLRHIFLIGRPDHRVWSAASWLLDHPDRWVWYAAHMVLLLTVLSAACIAREGIGVPLRLMLPATLVGCTVTASAEALATWARRGVPLAVPAVGSVSAWQAAGLGLAVGAWLAAWAQWAYPDGAGPPGMRRSGIAAGALAGLYLGPWWAIFTLIVTSLLQRGRVYVAPDWRAAYGEWMMWLLAVTLVVVLLHGPQGPSTRLDSPLRLEVATVIATVVITAMAMANRRSQLPIVDPASA